MDTLYNAAHFDGPRRLRNRQRRESLPILIIGIVALGVAALGLLNPVGTAIAVALPAVLVPLMLVYAATSACVRVGPDAVVIPIRHAWKMGGRQYRTLPLDTIDGADYRPGAPEVVIRTRGPGSVRLPIEEVPEPEAFLAALEKAVQAGRHRSKMEGSR